jgi:hypothetical protein
MTPYTSKWACIRRVTALFIAGILGIPEGQLLPLWLRTLFFPVLTAADNNPHFKYDYMSNVITICGNKFSPEVFVAFANEANSGKRFEFVKAEYGPITIKWIVDERELENKKEE